MSSKNVILFLTHLLSDDIVKEFNKIANEAEGTGDVFLYFDDQGKNIPDKIKKYRYRCYNSQEILELKYPLNEDKQRISKVPNQTAFKHVKYQLCVLKFFLENPEYDYYWYIEYDVRYTGNWGSFFNDFDNDSDLTASYVRTYQQQPNWPFWYLSHPTLTLPESKRISSFHPVMRISKEALLDLHNSLKDGWIGYLEMLIPTLLHEHGFKLEDFGGSGKFTNEKNFNKNYLGSPENINGTLDYGTMRYRPHIIYLGLKKNTLYHPVKSVKSRLTYYFVRAKRILMKKIKTFS